MITKRPCSFFIDNSISTYVQYCTDSRGLTSIDNMDSGARHTATARGGGVLCARYFSKHDGHK